MAADNIVEIEDLRFAYNENEIFKGISLNIPRGKLERRRRRIILTGDVPSPQGSRWSPGSS